MIFERVGYYINGKVFEWIMVCTTLGLAGQIFLWPESSRSGVFYWIAPSLRGIWMSGLFLFLGSVRFYGLTLNGHRVFGHRIGPWIRAIAGVVCAVVWGQFVVGLMRLSVAQGYPSPGIPLWLMVTLGEIYIAYRAIANAR